MRARVIIVVFFICFVSGLVFAQSEQPKGNAPFPAAIPIDIVFSIDSSGSMGPPSEDVPLEKRIFFNRDPDKLRIRAAQDALNSLNRTVHRVGVVSWDAPYQSHSGIDFSFNLSKNYDEVRKHLSRIDNSGGTDLELGLREALTLFERSPQKDENVKKVVIFLTDGNDTSRKEEFNNEVLNRAKELDVTVYTIGLELPQEALEEDKKQMTAKLKMIASTTGGRYFSTPTPENFKSIFDEIVQQVTRVFVDIDTTSVITSSSTNVTVRLNDISGVPVRTLEPVIVNFETTEGQLDPPQVTIPKGEGAASTTLDMGDKAGLATIRASVRNLSTQKTIVLQPVTTVQPDYNRVVLKLIVDEPGVAAGRPMEMKAVLIDDTGTPVPADKDYPLTFHFTPLDLNAAQQSHSFRLPGERFFLQEAFAQDQTAQIDDGARLRVQEIRKPFSRKGVLRKGETLFTLFVTFVRAALLTIRLESPEFPIQEEILLAFGPETPTNIGIRPMRNSLDADGKDSSDVFIYLSDKELHPANSGIQNYSVVLESTLGSIVPAKATIDKGYREGIILTASDRAGTAHISAKGITQDLNLRGYAQVEFELTRPYWHMLFAAIGGMVGGIIRRYRKLSKISTYQPGPGDFIGNFLLLESLAGVILYALLYYATDWLSLPFYRHFVFAVVIGTAVGYSGSVLQDKMSGRKQRLVILFTDLVDSTKRKKELGDEAAKSLEDVHKHLLLQSLGKFQDAKIVRVEGDSYIIVFQEVQNALHFALHAQMLHRQARTRDWRHLPSFRVGIHVGEVIVEEGVNGGIDIKGIQADTTARIMGMAEGGQILFSDEVYRKGYDHLKNAKLSGLNTLLWADHKCYAFKGREKEKIRIHEVREKGTAPFAKPVGGEKAKPVDCDDKTSEHQ